MVSFYDFIGKKWKFWVKILKPYAREGFPQATHTGPAGSSYSRSQA
jgi:hypothetical protein